MEKVLAEKLHQIAEEVTKQKVNTFWNKVDRCANKIIEDMENHLLIEAQAGRFQYSISISKYARDDVDSFDYPEFVNEVSNKLARYWKSRGFSASVSLDGNDFTLNW